MFIMMLLAFEFVIYIICMLFLWAVLPYQTAKKHGFIIVSLAMFMLCIYTIEKGKHFGVIESWVSIADNILSGSIFSILCVFFWRVEHRIKNKHEDSQKLTQDYSDLVKRYNKCNLVETENSEGKSVSYPVIEVGVGVVPVSCENGNIDIIDFQNKKYQLPRVVENNYVDIFSVHETSTIYNNVNIRVHEMSIKDDILTLSTERTTYYDSLVTNRAADFNFANGLTVREIFEPGPDMSTLKLSKMSNHLGFNGFVESSDGYFVFVERSNKMSIAKRTYGTSIGASLKTKYALDEDGVFTRDGLVNAIYREFEDELRIERNQIDEQSVYIIALYRDCVECGKPQLLIYAKSKLKAKEINKNFHDEKIERRKKLSNSDKRLKTIKDGDRLIWVKKQVLLYHIDFFERGIRIDPQYDIKDSDIISFDSGKNNSIKKSKWKMVMVPSASASVYFLRKVFGDGIFL